MLDPVRLADVERESRDDKVLLGMLAREAAEAKQYASAVREARVRAALRLHAIGVPMTEIARSAKMTDSYLARLVYRAGGERRLLRGDR